jgi:hypothetical protein
MPEPIIMKLGMHIMPQEAISKVPFIIPPTSNINTAASQIFEVIRLI